MKYLYNFSFLGISEDLDYDTKFPNKEFQQSWIRTYLTEFNGTEPTNKEVETLYVNVSKCTLLSHLFWGVWALVQAEYSSINFDYIGWV